MTKFAVLALVFTLMAGLTPTKPFVEIWEAKTDGLLTQKQTIKQKAYPPYKHLAIINQTTLIQESITKWAHHYGVSSAWLLRVAECESTLNPSAVNTSYYAGGGHPTGLFQYLPETWTRIQRAAGMSGLDIWNYEHQAKLTAWAFANGYSNEWECQ